MILFNLDDRVIEELCGPEALPKKNGKKAEKKKKAEEEKKKEEKEEKEETVREERVEEYVDDNRSRTRHGEWSIGIAGFGYLHRGTLSEGTAEARPEEDGGSVALVAGYGEGAGWGAELQYAPKYTLSGDELGSFTRVGLDLLYAFRLERFPGFYPRLRAGGLYQYLTFPEEGELHGGMRLLGGSAGVGISYYAGPAEFFLDLVRSRVSGSEGKKEYEAEETSGVVGVRFHFL